MNTYLVTLATGASVSVAAEDYREDDSAGLVFIDQFGGVVAAYKPGFYAGLQIVVSAAAAATVAPSVAVVQSTVTSSSVPDGGFNDGNL